jgi:hypothetical protein
MGVAHKRRHGDIFWIARGVQ